MKYNGPYARARWGTMAKDFEAGVDYQRLIGERFEKAQAAVKARGLGAILCFDMDNIRYVTGTLIGNVFRDFLDHFCNGQTVVFLDQIYSIHRHQFQAIIFFQLHQDLHRLLILPCNNSGCENFLAHVYTR